MEWHIVTGEYPPQLGGVADYTYQVSQELAKAGDEVHVWAPATHLKVFHRDAAQVHALPHGFGWHWLRTLNRRLRSYSGPRNILIQYVPHMYGWKSMNLAFCWWIFMQRRHKVCVMFHEVAFPFRTGQPFRHWVLAVVHRIMAWIVLRSVRHSFTSTEPYLALLHELGNRRTPVSMLRICSNIPTESYPADTAHTQDRSGSRGLFTVGIFSNFSSDLCELLEPAIGCVLGNPEIGVLLIGPGEAFLQSLAERYPEAADRMESTGRLRVTEIAAHMRRCNALLQLYPDGASAARGTLIGAMASGVPVVTTSGPATDGLLLDSGAMLFPKGSPRSILEAMELLKQNPVLAEGFGARAQRLYRGSFQPAVIAARIRQTASCSSRNELVSQKPRVEAASAALRD